MKLARLTHPVMASWFTLNNRRLDCKPYLSGAIEARALLAKLPVRKEMLLTVTKGIYHAGREGRTYVNDPSVGIPFLGSTDILNSDLSLLPFLSKKQVEANPLFMLQDGWTLITRSGTIGRMAFVRPDMAGMACSEHVMRVVPNLDKILPGYLYAYLSSKFGVPQVVGATYGSIITHIEPHHIAHLPVPIIPLEIQERVHTLVVEAARLRTEASALLAALIKELEALMHLPHLSSYAAQKAGSTSVSSHALSSRLDALFHSQYHRSVTEPLLHLPPTSRTTVGQMAKSVIEPPRFKRIRVNDSDYGIPFFGTTALMWADPVPVYYIINAEQYQIDEKTLLVPRSGQLNGIIGHVVLPHGQLVGGAVTEDAIRIVTDSPTGTGYLFIALSSEYGKRQLKARAFGSSIPHLDVRMVRRVIIPKPDDTIIEDFGKRGLSVSQFRSDAIEKEQSARELVEEWITYQR